LGGLFYFFCIPGCGAAALDRKQTPAQIKCRAAWAPKPSYGALAGPSSAGHATAFLAQERKTAKFSPKHTGSGRKGQWT